MTTEVRIVWNVVDASLRESRRVACSSAASPDCARSSEREAVAQH